MKKIAAMIMSLAVLGSAAASRPDKPAIVDKVTQEVMLELGLDQLPQDSNGAEIMRQVRSIVNVLVNSAIDVKNYIFFDVATVNGNYGSGGVAVGMFGKVMTFGKGLGETIRPQLESTITDFQKEVITNIESPIRDIFKNVY